MLVSAIRRKKIKWKRWIRRWKLLSCHHGWPGSPQAPLPGNGCLQVKVEHAGLQVEHVSPVSTLRMALLVLGRDHATCLRGRGNSPGYDRVGLGRQLAPPAAGCGGSDGGVPRLPPPPVIQSLRDPVAVVTTAEPASTGSSAAWVRLDSGNSRRWPEQCACAPILAPIGTWDRGRAQPA